MTVQGMVHEEEIKLVGTESHKYQLRYSHLPPPFSGRMHVVTALPGLQFLFSKMVHVTRQPFGAVGGSQCNVARQGYST